MGMTAAGFAELADVCLAIASGSARGRLVAVLEGGYDADGLAESTAAVVGRMLARPFSAPDAATRPAFGALLETYRATHARYWPVLK
jgi:acetoin utilization deacetylase AcuC-like enzyme